MSCVNTNQLGGVLNEYFLLELGLESQKEIIFFNSMIIRFLSLAFLAKNWIIFVTLHFFHPVRNTPGIVTVLFDAVDVILMFNVPQVCTCCEVVPGERASLRITNIIHDGVHSDSLCKFRGYKTTHFR